MNELPEITPEYLRSLADNMEQQQKQDATERLQLILNALAESAKSAETETKCVYILKMSNESVKIGVTKNFRQRARAIETGSGLTITDWCHSEYLPSAQAYAIETLCHKIFDNQKIRGEFFNVTFEEAQAELNNLVEITDCKNF